MKGYSGKFRDLVLPVIVLLTVYDIMGFIGNITVVYIYKFQYPKNRFRCLVLAMAMVDLTSCFTTIPMEIIATWLWFNFPCRELCKMKSFFIQFTENSAIYILFVTAVYKYRQICKPFSKQATQKSIVISCAVGFLFAIIFATPSAIMWDINNYNLTSYNISEMVLICEVNKGFHNTLYPAVYQLVLYGYTLFLLATVILYIFVARTTIQHFRRLPRPRRPETVFDNPVFTVEQHEERNEQEGNIRKELGMPIQETTDGTTDTYRNTSTPQQLNSTISTSQMTTPDVIHETHRTSKQTHNDIIRAPSTPQLTHNDTHTTPSTCQLTHAGIHKTSSTSNNTHKNSPASQLTPSRIRKVAIMVILAGTFSVTFFLALGVGYVFAVREFDDYKSLGDLVFFFCCYRFYFINYCLNPVVYFVLDGRFRKEVKKLIMCHFAGRSV